MDRVQLNVHEHEDLSVVVELPIVPRVWDEIQIGTKTLLVTRVLLIQNSTRVEAWCVDMDRLVDRPMSPDHPWAPHALRSTLFVN